MKIENLTETCTACMACYNICPVNAITMRENSEGFLYPAIDENICINCLKCEEVCPELEHNRTEQKELIQTAYYGWHNNDVIRKNSSSGGAFSAFAENILGRNGVVFGAVYNSEKKKVMHLSTAEVNLAEMRKSKYVQSYIGYSFRKAKEFLDTGREVLFVGTPCQISGLQTFLGRQYDRLITCDFICHGVPPMKLLKDDLNLLEKKYKSKIINFDFRPKVKTWTYDFFSIFFQGEKRRNIPWSHDSFFKGFMNNKTLRKSCYRCNYSATQHSSDITIADFWGYRRYDESIFDNRGLSLIIANTEHGQNFIERIDKSKFTVKHLEWKYAEYVYFERNEMNYNIKKRDAFFEDYKKLGYQESVRKHRLTTSNIVKLKKRLVRIKKRIWR